MLNVILAIQSALLALIGQVPLDGPGCPLANSTQFDVSGWSVNISLSGQRALGTNTSDDCPITISMSHEGCLETAHLKALEPSVFYKTSSQTIELSVDGQEIPWPDTKTENLGSVQKMHRSIHKRPRICGDSLTVHINLSIRLDDLYPNSKKSNETRRRLQQFDEGGGGYEGGSSGGGGYEGGSFGGGGYEGGSFGGGGYEGGRSGGGSSSGGGYEGSSSGGSSHGGRGDSYGYEDIGHSRNRGGYGYDGHTGSGGGGSVFSGGGSGFGGDSYGSSSGRFSSSSYYPSSSYYSSTSIINFNSYSYPYSSPYYYAMPYYSSRYFRPFYGFHPSYYPLFVPIYHGGQGQTSPQNWLVLFPLLVALMN